MILASTRCGLIACRYLAEKYNGNSYISAPEIAEKYNMNVRALMPALRQLTRAGILRSRTGGKDPGFAFSKHPKDISMLEIMHSLEGKGDVPCCKEIIPGLKCDCKKAEHHCIFNMINDSLNQFKIKLSRISIQEHSDSMSKR